MIRPQGDGYITLYIWVIMLIRIHTEFLPFLVLDVNIELTNYSIVTSQSLLCHCSSNQFQPD